MTTFKMLKPVAYMKYPAKKPEITKLDFQSAPSKSEQALGYVSEPLYTAQALKDVLEQAAQECVAQESYGPRHQSIYDCAEAIRKMIGEIK